MSDEADIRLLAKAIKRFSELKSNSSINSNSSIKQIQKILHEEFGDEDLTISNIEAARKMLGWPPLPLVVAQASKSANVPVSVIQVNGGTSSKTTSSPHPKTGTRPKPYNSPDKHKDRRKRDGTLPIPSAPFRFVKLHDRIAMPEAVETPTKRADRNAPIPDGYSARIHVEWIAETPLLIGSEVKEQAPGGQELRRIQPLVLGPPVKQNGFPNQSYIIPGATLKGLIRSACVTIAHGRVGAQINKHRIFPLRDFNHPVYAGELVKGNKVRAGELLKVRALDGSDAWQLTEMADWRCVEIAGILAKAARREFLDDGEWVAAGLIDKYRIFYQLEPIKIDNNDANIINFENIDGGFANGTVPISSNRFRNTAKFGGPNNGYLVFAGPFTSKEKAKKKYDYVFYPRQPKETSKRYLLSAEEIETFTALHTKPGELNVEPVGSWAELKPTFDAKKPIPVFYVGTPGQPGFHFGLTRLFKIPHSFSVGDVLKNSHPAHLPPSRVVGNEVKHEPDFVEELFGYVVDARDVADRGADHRMMPTAATRKGRVAFSMARLQEGQRPKIASDDTVVVMMAPRESFAPFYLGGPPELEKDYSSDPTSFAGPKRYIPRQKLDGGSGRQLVTTKTIGELGSRQIQQIKQASTNGSVSEEVKSRLRFLTGPNNGELIFESTIELHNVTAAEVGAILFALTHGGDPAKPYRHMLGRAKAFGAGQTRVGAVRLEIEANVPAIGDARIKAPLASERLSNDRLRGFIPASPIGKPIADNASHVAFLGAFEDAMRKAVGEPRFPEVDVVQEHLGAARPGVKSTSELHYMPLADFAKVRNAVNLRQPGSGEAGNKLPVSGFPEQSPDGRILPAPKTTRAVGRPKNGA